jgi:hypothetical protein
MADAPVRVPEHEHEGGDQIDACDGRVAGHRSARTVDELVGALRPLAVDVRERVDHERLELALAVLVGHDDELPRLRVSRAACERRRFENLLQHGVRQRAVLVDARCAETEDRVEDAHVGRVARAHPSSP